MKRLTFYVATGILWASLSAAHVPTAGAETRTEEDVESGFGLSVEEIVEVIKCVDRLEGESDAADAVRALGSKRVVPLLIHLAQSDEEPSRRRQHAMMWLGKTRDPRAVPALLSVVYTQLEESITEERESLLRTAITSLGFTARDEALDILFEMRTEAYWWKVGLPRPEPGENRPYLVDWLQMAACDALSYSGTERALQAFASQVKPVNEYPKGPGKYMDTSLIRLRETARHMAGIHMPETDPAIPREELEQRAEAIVDRALKEYGKPAPSK